MWPTRDATLLDFPPGISLVTPNQPFVYTRGDRQSLPREQDWNERRNRPDAYIRDVLGSFYRGRHPSARSNSWDRSDCAVDAIRQRYNLRLRIYGAFGSFCVDHLSAGQRPRADATTERHSLALFAMPFPSFVAQDLAISYAILSDQCPKPLLPHWLAWVNTALIFTFYPVLGVHCVHHGAVAWNGILSFWLPAAGFSMQAGLLVFYLLKAVGKPEELYATNVESDESTSKHLS